MSYDLQTLRGDVFGGLTAAVVALPLSLAFGVASGLGAIAGLYSAIAVGLIAAALGGSKTQISGPTAPLSVAMSVVVASYADSVSQALTIVMLAGAIQILMGSLRLGSFVSYTPYSVISGFMSGVGVIIILVQTLPLLGSEVALGGPLESVRSLSEALADIDFSALTLGVITLVVCVGWPANLKKVLPSTVAALIAGNADGGAVADRRARHRRSNQRLARPHSPRPLGQLARRRPSARDDPRVDRFHQQPAHGHGRRLDDPRPATTRTGSSSAWASPTWSPA